MSSDDHNPAAYFNIKLNTTIVDYTNSPEKPGSRVRRYVNIPISDSDGSAFPQSHSPIQGSPDKTHSPRKNEDRKSPSPSVKESSPLRRHLSETGSRSSRKAGSKSDFFQEVSDSSSVPVEQAIANAKFNLLVQQGGVASKGCEKCDELMELLASWQIGAGSLMRNYSRILSLLIRTRDSALALECRLNEQSPKSASALPNGTHAAAADTANATASSAVTNEENARRSMAPSTTRDFVANGGSPQHRHPKRAAKNRQSMFVTTSGMALASAGIREHDLAENMYPKREELAQTASSPVPPTAVGPAIYTKSLEELKTNLWGAIDMCQHLAAACFKKTHLGKPKNQEKGEDKSPAHSLFATSLHPSPHDSVPLSSSTPSSEFARKHSEGTIVPPPQFKSSLQTINEGRLAERQRKRQRTISRVPSAPSLECSGEVLSSSGELQCNLEDGYVHVSAEQIPDFVTKATKGSDEAQKETPTQNGSNNNPEAAIEEACQSNEAVRESSTDEASTAPRDRGSSADVETESAYDRGTSPASEGKDEKSASGRSDSLLSAVSTYTDSDVKYVMSKIASLEEERYKLMETIDKLHTENSTVRLSLHEILENLDNKDLQLTLAMQDLSIATDEIRKAADMRKKLKSLSGERDALLERLGALEDESSAVKVSLVHLLQEKSATNKTLALENWRLTHKQRRGSKNSSSDLSAPSSSSPSAGDDNISIRSGFSSTADDSAMQEAVMGADMVENFVHKQGFLVKQGGRVKSWRKRLFVLNTDGLSYYKTEQPIQKVPISKIEKVQLCHGRCPQPHMFEVHTRNRVFYLSASSADEMQSWVGMLETLKQYRRTATMHAKIMSKAKANSAHPLGQNSSSSPGNTDSTQPHQESKQQCTSTSPVAMGYPSEDDEPRAAYSVKALASSNDEGDSEEEEEEEHITLHQQPPKVVPSQDDDDNTTYLIGLRTGANLSVPEEGMMAKAKTRTSMSGRLLEGLDLSNL